MEFIYSFHLFDMIRIRNRIFYPAGLISLVLLPILCIWNLNKQNAFQKLGAIDVGYFYHDENYEFSNIKTFKNFLSSRNFSDIEFTGNKSDDKVILQYARIKIRSLIESKDTTNGIHFKLTEKAKYSSYVGVIEIFQNKNINALLDKNDVWYYYQKPKLDDVSEYYFTCSMEDYSNANRLAVEKLAAYHSYLTSKIKYIIPISILFFLLCFFSLKRSVF